MGLETATLAAISAGTTAVATAYSIDQNQRARSAQKEAQKVQAASNKAAQMEERRQQIREERVRRARILQAGENSGTSLSSGEAGALGGLSTNLSSNMSANFNKINSSQQLSGFAQDVADASNNAKTAMFASSLAGAAVDMSGSIFKTPSKSSDPFDYFYTN
jgi:hypothetical protein